jgi:hypothetical protein
MANASTPQLPTPVQSSPPSTAADHARHVAERAAVANEAAAAERAAIVKNRMANGCYNK